MKPPKNKILQFLGVNQYIDPSIKNRSRSADHDGQYALACIVAEVWFLAKWPSVIPPWASTRNLFLIYLGNM